jgi:hypothetical protein
LSSAARAAQDVFERMKVAAFVVDQPGDIAFRAHVLWQGLAWHELQRFIAIMPCRMFLPVGQQFDALP